MRAERAPLLVALAFASGVCGLAYEVLYTRLLATYLGDMVQVSAAVLASFLAGLGVGAMVAHRWYAKLWLLEVLIGVYGLGVALLTSVLSPVTVLSLVPSPAVHQLMLVLYVALVVAVPSLLIGCSVPLFSAYLVALRPDRTSADSFAHVYSVYNVGAGLCVLGLEFWLLRSIGLRNSIVAVAMLNLVTGLTLRWAAPAPTRPAAPASARTPRGSLAPWLALFAASALSACYQLLALKVVGAIFGPFHENFALLLAFVMLGLSLGSVIVQRYRIGLPGLLGVGGLGLIASAALLGELGRLWALLSGTFVEAGTLRTMLKALVMLAMTLPSFALFGATVPALLRHQPDAPDAAGKALGISSFGNCTGYLTAIFLLLAHLSDLALLTLVSVGTTLLGVLLAAHRTRRAASVLGVAVGLTALLGTCDPAPLLALGHTNFLSSKRLTGAERDFLGAQSVKRLDANLVVVTTRSGSEYVNINGYTSLAVAQWGMVNHREVLVGVAPALYPARRERALVLGTGTGVTAGATARLFDHTTVVEINPAVFAALPRFAAQNFALAEQPNVTLLLDDALLVLARSRERYDVVVSTVTSPIYFSSAKLYTRDFLELVKSRLSPGGVFAFWFDARLSDEGTALILQTVADAFEQCHFVFLDESYYEAICGAQTLVPRPLGSWPEPLRVALARYADDGELDALLDELILVPSRFRQRWSTLSNTFDRPTLEHVMAHEALAEQRPWDLDAWVRFELDRSAMSETPLGHAAIAHRCLTLANVGERGMLARCAQMLMGSADAGWDPEFVHLAYEHLLRTKRSVVPFTGLVRGLLDTHQPERALELLERRTKKRDLELELLRLELTLQLRGDVPDADLAEVFSRDPLVPEVRHFLVRLLLKRGRPEQALAQLDFLSSLRPLTAEEQRLRRRLGAPPRGETPP